ncbi:LanC-like protein 2 [Lobaria immixta]|nr:LanC-like protein 2 [Lobaria immixta]
MATSTERPQFYENNLQSIKIDKPRLIETLAGIRDAVRQGVKIIETSYPPPDSKEEKAFSSICDGHLGIALTYLRLEYQSAYLRAEEDESPLPDFLMLADARINPHQLDLDVQPGRPSPVMSAALGAAVMRIIGHSPISHSIPGVDAQKYLEKNEIETLHNIVQIALKQSHAMDFRGHSMGGDDIMTGRTGVLWAISNIRHHVFDAVTQRELDQISEAVPKLVDAIMDAGRVGAGEYIAKNGDANALPLMWLWFDGCYGLGGMHGTTGILSILLTIITTSPTDSPARTYLPQIARTITALSKLCVSHKGHLPMAIPELPSNTARASPLVQICNGTPGLLHLLAHARNTSEFVETYWMPEWDEAIRLASERVWEEGLLSKGGGLCHGIAGNAWPWLVLHDSFEYDADAMSVARETFAERTGTTLGEMRGMSGDHFLSRALAFLQQATQTQPFNMQSDEYRMPDKPYGLYEGLSGTICAWAEACVVLVARLRKMDLDEQSGERSWKEDESFKRHLSHELGFPTLGGTSVTGLL